MKERWGGIKIPKSTKIKGDTSSAITPTHGSFGGGPSAGSPKKSDARTGKK